MHSIHVACYAGVILGVSISLVDHRQLVQRAQYVQHIINVDTKEQSCFLPIATPCSN